VALRDAFAGVVTSTAAVMAAVFASFGISTSHETKQLGSGPAVAIVIDATLVRAVLLPAPMKLVRRDNWYLPKRLPWLPKLAHGPTPSPQTRRPPARPASFTRSAGGPRSPRW
jgi:putative drug exporter of the RND superfamily